MVAAIAAAVLLGGCATPPANTAQVPAGNVPIPKDDVGIKLMRHEGINGQRYTEIFLIGGNAATKELKGGVYNTVGLNDPAKKGDTCPAEILDNIDLKALAKEYKVLMAYKNGPRLWTLDWLEVDAGKKRDLQGLEAYLVMWLDVPKKLAAIGCKSTSSSTSSVQSMISEQRDDTRAAIRTTIKDAARAAAMVQIVDAFYAEMKSIAGQADVVRGKITKVTLDYDATSADVTAAHAELGVLLKRLTDAAKQRSLALRKHCSSSEWEAIFTADHVIASPNVMGGES